MEIGEKILNLTQHSPTPEQTQAGVINCDDTEEMRRLLTFPELPTGKEVRNRAKALAELAQKNVPLGSKVMLGGVPFLMGSLEMELRLHGLRPVYAFSARESEEKMEGGKVIKTQVFKHLGFVEV